MVFPLCFSAVTSEPKYLVSHSVGQVGRTLPPVLASHLLCRCGAAWLLFGLTAGKVIAASSHVFWEHAMYVFSRFCCWFIFSQVQ